MIRCRPIIAIALAAATGAKVAACEAHFAGRGSPAIPVPPPSYTDAQAKHDLRLLIETFRTAIIRKDKTAFLALFFDGPIVWQPVDSDPRLARSFSLGKGVAKIAIDSSNNPQSFIEGIVSSNNRHEETFENVQIHNDKDIASVIFDFSYRVNGKPITIGKEFWHVVRSESGWKIISVIYSRADPDRPTRRSIEQADMRRIGR